eukprot:jgi/Undpi1/4136/HiC_scaffold_16.g07503.m1
MSSPRSPGGGSTPPGRAEALGNPRASRCRVDGNSTEVGVNLDKLTEEGLSLRKKLKDREQTANECITKAKGRLGQTNKRAEAAFSELINGENSGFAKKNWPPPKDATGSRGLAVLLQPPTPTLASPLLITPTNPLRRNALTAGEGVGVISSGDASVGVGGCSRTAKPREPVASFGGGQFFLAKPEF